ncbi:MAG: radical SAM protein [Chitinivibrionales bacterium]|nr:radical SAM protein [Chitinivibrionales bacterium]
MKQIYQLIKLNRIIKSHRIKLIALLLADIFRFRHLFIRFDPIIACNLRCLMCPFSDPEFIASKKPRFSSDDIKRIGGMFFPLAYQCVVGCGAEPTVYKDYLSILRMAKQYGVPHIGFTTNGQLLTQPKVRELFEIGIDEITLSMHGVKKQTYERFMVNASFEKFHEILAAIDESKKRPGIHPGIRINYTVNPDNLPELADFFEEFGRYAVDVLQIRPMVDLGTTAYAASDLSHFAGEYQSIIDSLAEECRKRNITLLANRYDPSPSDNNPQSAMLQFAYRYISPQCVWREDLDWRNTSYREFCRKIGWRKILLKSIALPANKLHQMKNHLGYDIYS